MQVKCEELLWWWCYMMLCAKQDDHVISAKVHAEHKQRLQRMQRSEEHKGSDVEDAKKQNFRVIEQRF